MEKVLIITYYWPPAGGPGVQRWLNFVKYLRDFNIDPVVYSPKDPYYPIRDQGLISEIPKGIAHYSLEIKEPYRWARLFSAVKTKKISSGIISDGKQSFLEKVLLWIRGNFFIPDARKYWVKPSINFLSILIDKEEIKQVITTGPPHSLHLIGLGLKAQKNIRWIADFRDPWTSIGYHKKLKLTKASQQKHKELEYRVLNGADKIITTSETTKKEFEAITDKPIAVITNGYDTDYSGGANLDDKFTISHIGSLLTGRDPKNLWKVLSEMAAEDPAFRKELQLEFVGVVSKDVIDSLYRYELAPYLKLKGYMSHNQVLHRQRRAQVLLLVEIDSEETKGIIPGKLFEYIAAKRPILALGPKSWDAGTIVEETRSGKYFDYHSQDDLKQTVKLWYKKYREGKLFIDPVNTEKYSRKALTGKLAKQLRWE